MHALISEGTGKVLVNSPNFLSLIANPLSGNTGFDLPVTVTCFTRLYKHVDNATLKSAFLTPGSSSIAVITLLSGS